MTSHRSALSRSVPAIALRACVLIVAAGALASVSGCTCNPNQVSVPPDDCSTRPAPATVTIHASLAAVRPVGSPKQIKVNGNRAPGSSACFSGDASLLTTLQGTGEVTEPHGLGVGSWHFTITPLSGGDQPTIPPLDRVLAAGSSQTLRLAANAAGDLVVTWE